MIPSPISAHSRRKRSFPALCDTRCRCCSIFMSKALRNPLLSPLHQSISPKSEHHEVIHFLNVRLLPPLCLLSIGDLPHECNVTWAIAIITKCLGDQADKYQYHIIDGKGLSYSPKEVRALDDNLDARIRHCLRLAPRVAFISLGPSKEYEDQFDWEDQSSMSKGEFNTRWND